MLWMKRLMTTLTTLIATMRRVAAMGLLGCLMLAFMPIGCGSRFGPVTAMQAQSDGRPPVPRATVERLKACMEQYGEQLAPGSHSIHMVIKTDKNGVKRREFRALAKAVDAAWLKTRDSNFTQKIATESCVASSSGKSSVEPCSLRSTESLLRFSRRTGRIG